jgi:hypothetical protein
MTNISPRVKTWLTILGFGLPPVWSLTNKLISGKAAFRDFEAVACAGLHQISHQPLYQIQFTCEALRDPTSFVYLPVVADTTAWFITILGLQGFAHLYFALFVLSAVFMLGVVFACPEAGTATSSRLPALPGTRLQRWPFLAFIIGSALAWGNIAVISHALVLAGALMLGVSVIPFMLAVALTAVIKPVFLVYLGVLLLIDRPLWQRLLAFAAGVVIGLWPTVSFVAAGSELAHQWQAILTHFLYKDAGDGYYGWLKMIGLDGRAPAASAGYIVIAGLLCAGAFALAEGLKFKTHERLWLGLSLSTLLIPRLMPQDVFLFGPGLLVISLKVHDLRSPHPWLARIRDWGPKFVFYVCLMTLLGNNLDLGKLTTKIAIFAFSLYVMLMGYLSLYSDRERVLAPIKAFWPFKPAQKA